MKTNYRNTHFTAWYSILLLTAIIAISGMVCGCATDGQTYSAHGGTHNGNVGGGVSLTDTNNGITAGVNGAYDPATGSYSGEVVFTFTREPSADTLVLLADAEAQRDRSEVIPVFRVRPSKTINGKSKLNRAIQAALNNGAVIYRR
jgi:hypothetical protein